VQLVSYDRWHAIDFILSIAPVEISLGKGNWTLVREVSNVPRVTTCKDRTAVAAVFVSTSLADVGYLLLVESTGTVCPMYAQLELFIVTLSARSRKAVYISSCHKPVSC
jgi:hypothetical protein